MCPYYAWLVSKRRSRSSFSFRFYPNLYCTHTTSPLAQQRLRFTLLALDSARSLPDKKGRARSRSFQTRIFKKPSALIRGILCSALLFHSRRATQDNKIRLFVNSLSGAGRPSSRSTRGRIKRCLAAHCLCISIERILRRSSL